ncbi:MAG TPA: hypothetical protein DHV62_09100, partial [Elusimicrobia bacterium]|nr:hypothetical protein [Elusimicrobiota bacterium]
MIGLGVKLGFGAPGIAYISNFSMSYDLNTNAYLVSPLNSSNLYKQYPPLIENINFTWRYNGNEFISNLKIAKDIDFNLIAVDTSTANNYSVQALEAGNYWWKVRYY